MNLLLTSFKLCPSYGLGIIVLFMHLGAVVSVYLIFSSFLAVALIACILTSLFVVTRHYVWLNNKCSITSISVDSDGGWWLQQYSGESVVATISYPIFISRYLVIVNFTVPNKFMSLTVSVPICCDAMPEGAFRKLRAYLRNR